MDDEIWKNIDNCDTVVVIGTRSKDKKIFMFRDGDALLMLGLLQYAIRATVETLFKPVEE
jgi:hypothetical protein